MQKQEDDKTIERPSLTACPKCGSPAFDIILFFTGKVVASSGERQKRKNPKVIDVICKKSSCGFRASDVKPPAAPLITKIK